MATAEYACRSCRHRFPWFRADGPNPLCPRCGGAELTLNPWLLLTPDSDGLTDDDHMDALLAL
jgi:hypothetical protein